MGALKVINQLLFYGLMFILLSCKSDPKHTFKILALDSTITPIKISIAKLAYDFKNYQGRYIETTGTFYGAFEQSAFCTEKNLITGKSKCFWLRTNRHLEINSEAYKKMNGKKVHIKGLIDTTHRGHMGEYMATIEIYFWEQ